MQFTYSAYEGLIELLRTHGYCVADYYDYEKYDRCVILRHDIDNDPQKAVRMAEVESKLGVRSTYFVLVTSDFYNVFSKKTCVSIKRIHDLGHNIGLHFDEKRYEADWGDVLIIDRIVDEAEILSKATGIEIKSVSMHRPSEQTLKADLKIPGIVNSYGKEVFEDFKYLSDSRRRWREPVEEIIKSEQYNRLHILTHAFWYNEDEISLEESVRGYVNAGNMERWYRYGENFTDLESVMKREEVS